MYDQNRDDATHKVVYSVIVKNRSIIFKCFVSPILDNFESYSSLMKSSALNLRYIHFPKKWRGRVVSDVIDSISCDTYYVKKIGYWK
jgi:hypothetical protein